MTQSICSLVHSNAQVVKMVVLGGYRVGLELLHGFVFCVKIDRTLLLVFTNKNIYSKNSNLYSNIVVTC